MLTRVGGWTVTVASALALAAACGRSGDGEGGAAPDSAAASADSARLTLEARSCSAAELDPLSEATPSGLPSSVAETRRAILRAAAACDYDRLEALALRGGQAFTYSFGEDARPSEYWRELETAGQDPLAILVKTLSLPWARETLDVEPFVFYVWPSAYLIDADDEAWSALVGLYSPDEIETMQEYGGFIGWRVGITENGDWRFFVAGD